MSILPMAVTLRCDWPGCERVFRSADHASAAARITAKINGWDRNAGLDFCEIHPRHQAAFVRTPVLKGDGTWLRCVTCGWFDDDPAEPTVEDSQARWITHLPELLGDFGRRPGEPSDVERGAVVAAEVRTDA